MNEHFLNSLSTLLSFNSIEGEAKTGMPFGEQINGALNFFLSLADSFGLKTINYDGYAGEVVFGEGEEEFGILGHLDIVPAGTVGWSLNPFTLTVKDGFYYGRGIVDDKGPILACLYALKELKDSGVVPTKKIRLMVGTDEESGWKDIDYLKSKVALPEFGFSPDGDFPVGYAEKGIYPITFHLPELNNFTNLSGGTVLNAVCGYAKCEIKDKNKINLEVLSKFGLTLTGNTIESVGVSAHGSTPHLGKNALKPLFEYFLECKETFSNVLDCLFYDKYGVFELKSEQGQVTLSPNVLTKGENGYDLLCDLRIPAPLTIDDVLKVVDKFDIPYSYYQNKPPFMTDKDSEFVKKLCSSYNEVMNASEKPMSMGGSTYARAFSKGVSFGPQFPFEDCACHMPDEKISIQSFDKMYEIYKSAIFSLIK